MEPSDLEKSHSEAVVLPQVREIIMCILNTTPKSMEIPIRISSSTWTPWLLALESAQKNL